MNRDADYVPIDEDVESEQESEEDYEDPNLNRPNLT